MITSTQQSRDREWAAARRAVARAHHPDVGGNPEAFVTALTAIDAAYGHARESRGPRVAVIVVVRRAWWRRVAATVTKALRRAGSTRRRYAQL